MNYKLYGYKIGQDVIGQDIETWNDSDLNGDEPFILTDSPDLDKYAEINTLEYWDRFGDIVTIDFQEKQRAIRLLGYEIEWENMTNDEKDIIIKYNAYPDIYPSTEASTERISYLTTTHSMTETEARHFLVDQWINYWDEFIEGTKDRWHRVGLEHVPDDTGQRRPGISYGAFPPQNHR